MDQGYAWMPQLIPAVMVDALRSRMIGHGVRGLARDDAIVKLAEYPRIRAAVTARLGEGAELIGALWFDKTPAANWRVPWHQDRHAHVHPWVGASAPWGAWSERDGVPRVLLPEPWASARWAARIHLDPCDHVHGPLELIPGSHGHGVLDQAEMDVLVAAAAPVTITAAAGDVLFMHPHLLHRSAPARAPQHRRVVHLEWCALPPPLPASAPESAAAPTWAGLLP